MYRHLEQAEPEAGSLLAPGSVKSLAPSSGSDHGWGLDGMLDRAGQAIGETLGDLGRGFQQDGLGGLVDLEGLLDRQRAQRDLADRFEIIEPDHGGKRLPNQVTREEFEAVARQFSDVRLGRTDLVIDESSADDPDAYRASVLENIADIMQTRSGRELIGQLADNTNGVDVDGEPLHKRTTIKPHRFGDELIYDNATTDADDERGVGAPFRSGRPGRGSDAEVEINPERDVGDLRSDVGLFHELVHAYTYTNGIFDGSTVESGDGEAIEPDVGKIGRYEHQAVGLGRYRRAPLTENAYRRERRWVSETGLGREGDSEMPQRASYLEADDA